LVDDAAGQPPGREERVYYIEFFRKKPNVSLEEFQRVVGGGFKRWAKLHPEDAPVLAIARTWRLGPAEAQYMIVWEIPDFARIDEWTVARRSDPASAAAVDEGTISVADVDAGVYEDIGLELL
jgi:hypothetical protein